VDGADTRALSPAGSASYTPWNGLYAAAYCFNVRRTQLLTFSGITIGLVLACFPLFVLRGLALLARRKWRQGLANCAGGLGALIVSLLGVYLVGVSSIDGSSVDPSQKARILAESLAEAMNCACWTAPLGILAGFCFAFDAYRKHAV